MDVKGKTWDKKRHQFTECSRPLSWGTAELKSFEAEKYQGKHCCEPAQCQLLAGMGLWLGKTFDLCSYTVNQLLKLNQERKAEIKEESSAHLCI